MSSNVTVGIPVGSRPGLRRWLGEALQSCAVQTLKPDEVVLVYDEGDDLELPVVDGLDCRVYRAPWKLGCANAFNHVVGLAKTPYVFLLASDDTLEPDCLQAAMSVAQKAPRPESTIVWVGVRYMKTGETQALPCGAMMVPKALWERIGGYPLECIFGAPDHVLLTTLLAKGLQWGISIRGAKAPLYNYRTHEDTEQYARAPWHGVMGQVRDILYEIWEPLW